MSFRTETLSMEEVRAMRVRDIKRRLSRTHGYSAEELGRILDKKELIEALSFEEHKDREKEKEKLTRFLAVRTVLTVLAVAVVALGWPLWMQIYSVVSVNFVVYTDRKRHEAARCIELRSYRGMFGVLMMAIIDILQAWLSVSVSAPVVLSVGLPAARSVSSRVPASPSDPALCWPNEHSAPW